MSLMVRPLRPSLVFILFAVFLCNSFPLRAQDFVIYDNIEQLQARIARAGDTTLVLNFWATWCKPCVEELPCFDELRDYYGPQNVQIVLISLDFKSQLERKFVPFLKSKSLESDVVLLADQDVDTWIPMFDDMWDGALPATLVLNGKQRIFVTGEFSSVEELKKVVESLKAETPRFRSPVTCGSKLAGQ